MKFDDNHKEFFDCKDGAYSIVTDREYDDSQITLDKDEKKLFIDFFGSSNILHGNRALNPELALKQFLLYPSFKQTSLNLLFPKHNKPELRLYIASEKGYKPKRGEIWFAYVNKAKQLVIGSMSQENWDKIKPKKVSQSIDTTKSLVSTNSDDATNYEVNQHSFEPGAMSIIQMGQELIGHPSTAVSELVKNGYDADATSCKVYFHYDPQTEESFAVIFDNGTGMDDSILFGSWLQPSVSLKREGTARSPIFKRHFLGSKGIGRLAAMALGQYVTVVTKQITENDYNWITLNREEFRAKRLLSQIKFPGHKAAKANSVFSNAGLLKSRKLSKNKILNDFIVNNDLQSFSQGTLIVIEKLDDSVQKILNQDFISETELAYDTFSYKSTEFYKGLATLITPISLSDGIQEELIQKHILPITERIEGEGHFNLDFGTNLLPDQDENSVDWLTVAPIPIQSVYDYRVFGKVTNDGAVKGFFVYNRIEGEKKEESFDIPAEEIRDDSVQTKLFKGNSSPEVGEYYFDIRIYDIGEGDNLEKLTRDAGFENKSEFKSAFKDFQGLRVSKNGFGVKPYGEEVEDWIGLSKERVNDPGHNVNTNQILGYVFFFSPQNDALEEKTNREGFLRNTAFIQVTNDLRKIFKNLGVLRYNYRVLNGIGRIPQSRHQRPDFEAYLNYLKATDNISQIREYSQGFMQDITTSMDNLEESLTFSERLASLGSGVELVYHEIAQPISGLRTTSSSLKLKKDKIDPEAKENFIFDIQALNHATEVLVELRNSLQPAIGKSRPKNFKPYETFQKVCFLFKSDIDEENIKIHADIRLKSYVIKDVEYAFWVAVLNIINNAVYWIKKSGNSGEIRFNIKNDQIIISNTGPLIDKNVINTLFEYGVTTKRDRGATGLGLAFTRSILSRINWEIDAANSKEGPVFTIKRIKNE